MTLPIAILAGGLATRLRPVTDAIPKALVDVAGRPFAEHQIELLARNGVTRVVFCVGHLGNQIKQAIGDGDRFGAEIEYVDDGPVLLGTGGAIRRALPLLGDEFLVMYGDSYLECDYQLVARTFQQSAKQGLMTIFRNEGKWEASNVKFEGDAVVAYDKLRPDGTFQHVDYGLGAFRAETFLDRPEDKAFDLTEIYRDLISRHQLAALEVPTRFFEIGSITGLLETRRHLAGSGA